MEPLFITAVSLAVLFSYSSASRARIYVNFWDLTSWFLTIRRTDFLFAEMAPALPAKPAVVKHGEASMPAAQAIRFALGLPNQS